VALAVHLLALLVTFPEQSREALPDRQRSAIVIKRYVPPPPPIEQRAPARAIEPAKRRIPLPDPTPAVPEPVREPEPALVAEVPIGTEFLLGTPEPPPAAVGLPGGSGNAAGPLIAGAAGVTPPVRIPESYVRPAYPVLAREARIEGDVILQAVIRRDGSVSEAEVLRCSQPGFGFEEAAVEAVTQWRYLPATQNDRPVAVYFTIFIEFELV